jgi:hypothetical protein
MQISYRMRPLSRRLCGALVIFSLAAIAPGAADTLEAPQGRLERGSVARFLYRTDRVAAGAGVASGTLTLDWTDMLGRQVEHRVMPVRLSGQGPGPGSAPVPSPVSIPVQLDLTRVVATGNTLRGRLRIAGWDSEAAVEFVVPPQENGWTDWQTIMWASQNEAQLKGLRQLGITANKVTATRERELTPAEAAKAMAPLLQADLAPYIENIATDFYASYHRWRPNKSVTALFDEARQRYRDNPADPAVRLREPSLSDPEFQARIDDRLARHVKIYGRYGPLFYNLGDEIGIADLAANWDFDFGPQSLAGMRTWLRTRYPSLPALNAQWGTAFSSWNDVIPPTTDATVARTDGNYSAWSDFKEWMDEAFFRALRRGTNAVHAADPRARSGIEGVQAPGWGGYDFTRMAHAADVLEIYDMHNAVDIAMAMNPSLITVSTGFATGRTEVHRVWREALQGQRGGLIWDEKNATVNLDGTPGPRGEDLGDLYKELRGGIGAQLIASKLARDPVAILYSPASYRVTWMLDVRADRRNWTVRDSEAESFDSVLRSAMRRSAALLQHSGVQPHWLSPELLADGALQARGIKLLILPHVLALSDREAAAIAGFVRRGGVVLADVVPGEYDGHGRKRVQPALAQLGGKIRLTEALQRDDAPAAPLQDALHDAGVVPLVSVEAPDGTRLRDVDIRQFRNGAVTIVGLQSDMPAAGESGPARPVVVVLRQPGWATDMRVTGKPRQAASFAVQLDPAVPAVLALSPSLLPKPVLSGPRKATLGEVVTFDLRLSGRSPALTHVLHLQARDPAGQIVSSYSENVVLKGGKGRWKLKLAVNDKPGTWTVMVRDALGAGEILWPVAVQPSP